MKTKLTLFTIAFSLLALTLVSGAVETDHSNHDSVTTITNHHDAVSTYQPVYEPYNAQTTTIDWSHEDAENTDDGDEPEGDEWDDEDAENEESEQEWDDEDAENEEDGTEDEDEETEETAEQDEDAWDHEDADDTDDGDEPEDDEWSSEDAENDDDAWDHEDAENTDDGDQEEESDEETEGGTAETRTRSYIYPQSLPDYDIELQTNPETIYAGETFTLEGNITGEDIENEEATIYVNGEERTSTTINENGNFEADLTIEEAGEHDITIEALGEETESTLNILSEDIISELDAPQVVSPGQEFDICTEVQADNETEAVLTRNGEELETTTGSGEVCFETTAPNSGTHTYTVTAENDEEEITIEVRDNSPSTGDGDTAEGGLITGNFLYQGVSSIIGSIVAVITGIFSAILP